VKQLLSSHRRRRRAAWIGVFAAVAGAVAFVGIHWTNTGKSAEAPFTNEPVQTVAPNPHAVAFSGQRRKEVLEVAAHFVATAVVRRHLDTSWDLLAPSMKSGFTRATWSRGEIPVVPYRAEAVGFVKSRLDYSYPHRVGLQVAIFPKTGVKDRAQAFEIELRDLGSPGHPKWLVSYWVPTGGQGVAVAGPASPAVATSYKAPKGIGAIWLLVPVVLIVGSIVLLLVSLAVRGWLRHLRAERSYSRAP
jgi:hypothetical protein